jgi:hypothetical protein
MAARNRDTEAALERSRSEAEARIARMLSDAEDRSTSMVAEARATADRVRAESERELAAAAQRRDSINAQLSNVRQMLATLTGTVPGVALPELEADVEPEALAEPAGDTADDVPAAEDADAEAVEAQEEGTVEGRDEDAAGTR